MFGGEERLGQETLQPTGALHGFLSMLIKLAAQKPDYLLVAFDMHGPTFRHETYTDYKAGRRETPEDLRAQFPLLKTLLSEMSVAVCVWLPVSESLLIHLNVYRPW